MQFIMKNSFYILAIFSLAILAYTLLNWESVSVLQKCICFFDVALIVHVFLGEQVSGRLYAGKGALWRVYNRTACAVCGLCAVFRVCVRFAWVYRGVRSHDCYQNV